MQKGKYIVLEGPGGTGKSSQILELSKRFQAAKLPFRIFREPDSQSDLTARAIRQLTQDPHYPMNTRTETLLYNAARSQSLQVIKTSIEEGINCIVDRSFLTTLAIQYYGRGDVDDYQKINQIIDFAVDGMYPDLCIVLDAPTKILKERLNERDGGERFDHLDLAFLERVRSGYLWEAEQRKYPVVFTINSIEDVANEIWNLVAKTLAIRDTKNENISEPTSIKEIIKEKKEELTEQSNEGELLTKIDGKMKITQEGKAFLDNILTDSSGDVYVFNDKISPITVAAAMARLSRRFDDLRVTLLDEFAGKMGKDNSLLRRIITAYGDDSVQQLAGIHLVVENASNLLTKKLEWGRLAAYLEQSTRYIFYDEKDENGNYRYIVPESLNGDLKAKYISIMDKIFDNYSVIVKKLTDHVRNNSKVPDEERDIAWKGATKAQACDAARNLLPVATLSTVGIYISGQSLESLIYHLWSDELPEANTKGDQILKEARKVIPMFLERADKPERGGAFVAYRAENMKNIKKLAKELLPETFSAGEYKEVTLNNYFPKNELDLAADMLYSESDRSLEEIKNIVDELPYDEKIKIFNTYIGERLNRRHRPGRALEKAYYSYDIVCDFGIFRDLQRHRMVSDLDWQTLSPRFGYSVPELIEEAGLVDLFEDCFVLSLSLYSEMLADGKETEAQYATLMGHRMRWKITYNAREAMHFHELRTAPQGHPEYRRIVKIMHDELAKVHPILAESMKFVNKDEDPELTRLAAERYTQFKLKKLNKE
ncbi:MAG: dTMP kinase [bacterium]